MKRKKPKITEAQLAEAVVEYLEDWQWEVYQEVVGHRGRCDIIAVKGNIKWAIECKLAFGFPVLEQAYNWKRYCHYVSVAVPTCGSGFGEKICRNEGIGILHVDTYRLTDYYYIEKYGKSNLITEKVPAKLFRQALGVKLAEEQKHWAKAGSQSDCGYFTPFKRTVKNMIDIVTRNEGIEYNKLIETVDHHYKKDTTAKSCLRTYIGKVIPQLEIRMVGKKACVFLKQDLTS